MPVRTSMSWMELAPDTGPMPKIVVVPVETAEMQYDSIETSQISGFAARFSMHHLFSSLCGHAFQKKISKARSATRTPSNGLDTANQKDTSQPEPRAVRVRFSRL